MCASDLKDTEITLALDELGSPLEVPPPRPAHGLPLDGSPPTHPLPARYTLGRRLGRGGMGEVYAARDLKLGCDVAVKLLAWRLVDNAGARARFLREAHITARLRHPGVVPVHDHGVLPDGRLWYAMAQVRGRTLAELLVEGGLPQRRALEILIRATEALAHAHEQGVIHRDLKPENLMVGEFGQVHVMDWGLARAEGEAEVEGPLPREDEGAQELTLAGTIMGTPGYIPPEVFAGGPYTPRSDVFAVGAILYHLLAGHPAFPPGLEGWRSLGSGPPPALSPDTDRELAHICRVSMAYDPGVRYPHAGVMWEVLRAWSEGAHRRERALQALAEAAVLEPHASHLRERAQGLADAAREGLALTQTWDPVDIKAPLWRQEEEAAALSRQATTAEVRWLTAMQVVLQIDPELPQARQALASHYSRALIRAEQRRDLDAADHAEAMLRVYDDGTYGEVLAGSGRLNLVTDPPHVQVEIFRIAPIERRLQPAEVVYQGEAPLHSLALPQGSYLCLLRAPGCQTTRYPIWIERGQVWDSVPPGHNAPQPVRLLREGQQREGECYVPAGWFVAGGDPKAAESLPRRRVWVEDMIVQRDPLSNAEYLTFLNDLVATGQEGLALQLAPRIPGQPGPDGQDRLALSRGEDGIFSLPDETSSPLGGPSHPVVLVTWSAATTYAGWLSARTQRPYRLLHELEWEKAARGVDGRACAWGDYLEPTWANTLGGRLETPGALPPDLFPLDESLYGVRGTVGNVRTWCANVWTPQADSRDGGRLEWTPPDADNTDLRACRGGAWLTNTSLGHAAARFAIAPHRHLTSLGFRLGWTP